MKPFARREGAAEAADRHTPKPIVPIFNRRFPLHQIDLLRQVPEIDEYSEPQLPAAPD